METKKLILVFYHSFLSLLASCVFDELSTAERQIVVVSSCRPIQTDTCTVRLSTILSDSLATSGDTVCQIGTIDDPVWGKIKAAFYVEYDVPTVSFSVKMPTTDSTPLPSGSIHRVTIWEIP